MIRNLDFDIDWLATERGSDAERASFGALRLRAGEVILTDVIDIIAQTPRTSIRVCLNRLGHWLADNWWRLRWEPMPKGEPSLSWMMAHQIGAAGGGFVWPKMRFGSDGETVTIQTKPTKQQHTIRYIEARELVCSAIAFERWIDELLSMVLSRQEGLGAVDSDLHDTWRSVLKERQDPEATAFRKREALLCLNPGEIDANVLGDLFDKGAWIGQGALDETLADTCSDDANSLLDTLVDLSDQSLPRLSFERVFEAASEWGGGASDGEPWEKGDSLARHFRERWGLGNGPVSDEFLNDLLGADIHSDELAVSKKPPFVAFRDDECLRLALRKTRYKASRRFAIARLLADTAVAAASDALHPLTSSRTARQKLQRAAAQEFLCPIDGLRERLSLPYPDEEELADAVEHFQVYERVVTNALINKNLVDRAYLE